MILTCSNCGATYDAAELEGGNPVRCACGDLLLVPEADALNLQNLIENYVERWSSTRGLSASQLADHGLSTDATTIPVCNWNFVTGSVMVTISHDRSRSELAISARVMPLPVEEESRLALCERVLALNLSRTVEARFAIDRDELVVLTRRPTLGLDFHEFQNLVECVAGCADDYDDELRSEFGAHEVDLAEDSPAR